MLGSSLRLLPTAFLFASLGLAPALAESGAFVDLTPSRAARLAPVALATAPEIPGVTYPAAAPPDLKPIDLGSETNEDVASDNLPDQVAEGQPDPQSLEVVIEALAQAAMSATQPPGTPPEQPKVTLRLDVDLAAQRLTVTENDAVRAVWPISSGRAPTVTHVGTFRPQWASRMWYSRQYDMAPMPYAVFFNGGIAFHATQAVHLLGRPASHGCVRLALKDARTLYGLVHTHGFAHTRIVVSGAPRVAQTEKRKSKPSRISSHAEASTSFWPFF